MKTNTTMKKHYTLYRIIYTLVNFVFFQFYRKVTIIGKHNIPRNEAFFVTPNHQNSMMDAMAVLFTLGRPHPFFLARADIFKTPWVGRLLMSLKLLPIYRIRDGKDSLQNNAEIFQKTVDIVNGGVPIVIFPEGNHLGFRRFRDVKKGIIRTAFTALEQFGDGRKLYLIPTGIEYNTSYEKVMQNLIVYYGKPILVNDFIDVYRQDKARAERQLQLALFERMSDQMIDIKTKDYYALYDITRETVYFEILKKQHKPCSPTNKFFAQKEMISALDKALAKDETPFAAMQQDAKDYMRAIKRAGVDTHFLNKEHYSKMGIFGRLLAALLLFPITLYGWVFNGWQFLLAKRFADKNKDPQWRSTVRFVMGITLFPLTHLLYAGISLCVFDNNWWSLAALASFIISGNFALRFHVFWNETKGRIHYNRLKRFQDADLYRAMVLRHRINEFVLSKMK